MYQLDVISKRKKKIPLNTDQYQQLLTKIVAKIFQGVAKIKTEKSVDGAKSNNILEDKKIKSC